MNFLTNSKATSSQPEPPQQQHQHVVFNAATSTPEGAIEVEQAQSQREPPKPEEQSKCRKFIGKPGFFLACVILAAFLVIFFLNFDIRKVDSLSGLVDEMNIFRREDPFANANKENANRWKQGYGNTEGTYGNGLSLTIVNALDSNWHSYFDRSVDEWENGTPDALTLKTTLATTPSDGTEEGCNANDDVLKVCNGDYGKTEWKGHNRIYMRNGWIIASTAMLNDRWFRGSDGERAKRAYTMCHEIGHGFGIPHTDESFWNRNQGNCLDYTTRYAGNQSPDEVLFNYLVLLYGTIPDPNAAAPTTTTVTQNNKDNKDNKDKEDRRNLRNNSSSDNNNPLLFTDVKDVARRARLLQRVQELDRIVLSSDFMASSSQQQSQHGFRRLTTSASNVNNRDVFEVDLDHEYSVQMQFLRA